GGAAAPAPARSRRERLQAVGCRARGDREGPRVVTRALGAAGLGAAMLAGALAFGSTTLYLPSAALIALAAGAWAWVALAAAGAGLERRGGPHTVEEEREWPL